MALTAKKLGITSEKIKAMTLEQLEDALTDVIDAREGYPENSMSKNALELDELYLEIDTRINAINAGEETCNYNNMQIMKIKIPTGYIIVEQKGAEGEYPGCYIRFSKDGTISDDMVACVEYDTTRDDGSILVETYTTEQDEPNHIINWQTGDDRLA